MEERVLGRTERPVSVIGLGTWQLGADWGEVSETAGAGYAGRPPSNPASRSSTPRTSMATAAASG